MALPGWAREDDRRQARTVLGRARERLTGEPPTNHLAREVLVRDGVGAALPGRPDLVKEGEDHLDDGLVNAVGVGVGAELGTQDELVERAGTVEQGCDRDLSRGGRHARIIGLAPLTCRFVVGRCHLAERVCLACAACGGWQGGPMTSSDRARQIVVTLAEIFCVLGTLIGVGVIGTPVSESAGGSLAADATLLAPAGPAFSIWSVIYVGLAAYTVWQWLPTEGRSELAERTGWMVAASMVLNAVWLLVTQQGWVWVSVVVILALLLVLVRLALEVVSSDSGSTGTFGTWLVRATVGLYLGWVSVATFANIAAALVGSGVPATGGSAVVWGLVGLVVAGALAVTLVRMPGVRWFVAAAVVWGLAWLVWGRLTDEPRSTVPAVAAAVVALAVVAAALRAQRSDARSA